MAVLVTGLTGFIGSHLGRCLVAEGEEVWAIVRPGADTARIKDYRARVHLIEADLAEPDDYRPLLVELRPERAFHVAWFAEHGRFWSAPENLDSVGATLALIRALADAGCARLVAVGSCAEYRWQPGPLSEDKTPCEPQSLYGVAKNATRQIVCAAAEELGIALAWARLFFPFGPGEAPTRLIPAITLALLRGERARCSHGRQLRDFVHVEDCAYAFRAIADSTLTGPVNLGTGRATSIASVAEQLAVLCGRSGADVELGAIPAPADDPPEIVADPRRLASSGWLPMRSLEEGLAETVEWWRKAL